MEKYLTVPYHLDILDTRISTKQISFNKVFRGRGQMSINMHFWRRYHKELIPSSHSISQWFKRLQILSKGIPLRYSTYSKKSYDSMVYLEVVLAVSLITNPLQIWKTTQQSLEYKVRVIEMRNCELLTK